MGDLLETVIEAHGGMERWTKLDNVPARLIQGGALWALKGQAGVLDDVGDRTHWPPADASAVGANHTRPDHSSHTRTKSLEPCDNGSLEWR